MQANEGQDVRVRATDDVVRRAQGCWLGQLTGDALGSMVEFEDGADLRRRYPHGLREIGPSPVWRTLPGQPTDDSELALMLARSLAAEGRFDEEQVAAAYGHWRQSGPFDVGGTIGIATRAVVVALRDNASAARAARAAASETSQANGALMRQSPLAIWGHALPAEELDRHVRADTTLTHPHPINQDASSAFVGTLAAVIREGLDSEGAYLCALTWNRQFGSNREVMNVLEAARWEPPQYNGPRQGWVLIALQNAFYQALHAPSFEEGVVATVMGGGDTDTNGAIAGALLGAIHGVEAVPERWREAILTCRPERGRPDVRQPRPEVFWPIDALELAERLVRGQ